MPALFAAKGSEDELDPEYEDKEAKLTKRRRAGRKFPHP